MTEKKKKIIKFTDGPDSILKNLKAFNLGDVVGVNTLPTSDIVSKLWRKLNCNKCGSTGINLVSFGENETVAAAQGRCLACSKLHWLFFSSEEIWSADIIIVIGSSKDETYKQQFSELTCQLCGSDMVISPNKDHDKYDIISILPFHHSCKSASCKFKLNFLFWDTPMSYFKKAMALAKEVFEHSEKAGLVFVLSALETYLQKAFMFSSTGNKYLVNKRKVNFQNLSEASEIYNAFMNINLNTITPNSSWAVMKDGFKKRHGIIHNAGMDRNFVKIIVEKDYVNKLKSIVEEFVNKLNAKLEEQGLF